MMTRVGVLWLGNRVRHTAKVSSVESLTASALRSPASTTLQAGAPVLCFSVWAMISGDARCLIPCNVHVMYWMAVNRLKLNADKTELPWTGSRYGPALLGNSGLSLNLGTGFIRASDYVCQP